VSYLHSPLTVFRHGIKFFSFLIYPIVFLYAEEISCSSITGYFLLLNLLSTFKNVNFVQSIVMFI